VRCSWKGLRSLPMVFMNEAAEAIAAHDRTSGFGLPDGRSALWDSKIETAMRPLSVVVVDVRLEHRFEMTFVHMVNGLDNTVTPRVDATPHAHPSEAVFISSERQGQG
jgi:hypothetical protein